MLSKQKFRAALWTAVSFLCWQSLSAQQTDDGDTVDNKKVKGSSAYIIYTGGGKFFDQPITVRSGKKNTSIQLSKRSASNQIKIHAGGLIQFIRETPDTPESPFRVYAKALIPEGVQKALILLTPLKKAKGDLLFSARVVSLAGFKQGNWLFINLTPRNVAVKLGDMKLVMKPNQSTIYKAGNLTKSTNMPVSYASYHPDKKEWKLLSSSTCVIRPTRREICVFSWNPKSERMDYHGITFAELVQK